MKEIELVIKIPEDVYTRISNNNPSYADDFPIYYAIKNGTPLPKAILSRADHSHSGIEADYKKDF